MINAGYLKATSPGGGPVLPSGTYTPTNTVSGEFDLLWINATANVSTNTGTIEKISGSDAWNASAQCVINHNGNFTLKFKIDFSSGATSSMFGLSYVHQHNSYENLDFCFYRQNASAFVWENGVDKPFSSPSVNDSSEFSISRDGNDVKYYIDGTLYLTSSDLVNVGPMNIDCSIFGISSVVDIEVIIP